ncbi:MAG: phosphatase PAP2 family protein [Phormidesmis sp. FL-bin-119]|nr:phosphatase PAP2 family protein [Pedobacter sp.]
MKIKILFILFFLFRCGDLHAQSLDLKILERLNGPPQAGQDKVWRSVSNNAVYIEAAAPLTMFVTGIVKHDENLKIKAYEAGISLIGAEGAAYVLKKIVKRDRPFVSYPDIIIPKVDESDYSFPSGHTALAFSMATSLSLSFPKWYVIVPSFVYAGTVSYSRLYLGVHYPSDILGGAAVGIASSYLTFKTQKWLSSKKHHLKTQ